MKKYLKFKYIAPVFSFFTLIAFGIIQNHFGWIIEKFPATPWIFLGSSAVGISCIMFLVSEAADREQEKEKERRAGMSIGEKIIEDLSKK